MSVDVVADNRRQPGGGEGTMAEGSRKVVTLVGVAAGVAERTYTGVIIWDFTVKDDQVVTTNPVANGTRTDKIDCEVIDTSPISVSAGSADHFTCSGDRVTTESDGFVATFTRE